MKKLLAVFSHFPIEYQLGINIIVMGFAIAIYPSQMIPKFISEHLGMSTDVIGIIFCLTGGMIFAKPKLHIFILLTFPYMLYIILGIIAYMLMLPNVSVSLIVYIEFYFLMLRIYYIRLGE